MPFRRFDWSPFDKDQVNAPRPESSFLHDVGSSMMSRSTRRALFARLRGGPLQLRPPWSKAEDAFTDSCTQCGVCLDACPAQIIVKGHAGYPIVDFSRGGCTFCGACADACQAGAFEGRTRVPWTLHAAISSACIESKGVACRICGDACDASAIRFRPSLGGRSIACIDPAACTGCGACVVSCPVGAIAINLSEPALEASS